MQRLLGNSVAVSLLVAGAGLAQGDYVFTTIDVPGAYERPGFGSYASGVNDAGQIVGGYFDAQQLEPGFPLSHGQYTTLDAFGAATRALGINSAGQIVGNYGFPGSSHGFLLSGGSYTSLEYSITVTSS